MTPAVQSFTLGAASFAGYVPLALVALRLSGKLSPVARLAALALVVHVVATSAGACCLDSIPYWHGAALYWCSFIFALFAFSAVYKSVSLRMLAELARKSDHTLSLAELSAMHIRPQFIDRIHLLVAAGYITDLDGKFRLSESGRSFTRRFRAVQRLFGIERSGLYNSEPLRPFPNDKRQARNLELLLSQTKE